MVTNGTSGTSGMSGTNGSSGLSGSSGSSGSSGLSSQMFQLNNQIINYSGWTSGNTYWEYTYNNEFITDNCVLIVTPDVLYHETVRQSDIQNEINVENGYFTLYAINQPEDDIHINITIIQVQE